MTNFSYSGSKSNPADNSDTAPAFHMFAQHTTYSLMRFKT